MPGRAMVVTACLAFLLAGEASSQQSQESPPRTPASQLDAIIAEYDAAMEVYVRTWNEAPEEERAEVTRRLYILPDDDLIPRTFALVKAHPGTETAARGLAWVVEVSRGGAGGQAARALVEDYLDSPHTVAVCGLLSVDYENGEELLTRVLTDSPLRELRGHALLARASQRKELYEIEANLHTEEGRKQYTDWYGAGFVARLRAADPEELVAEAEADYR